MERTTLFGRLIWQVATVVSTMPETKQVKSITFDVPGWRGHLSGQHVDVRLTAEDGYQATRSYSIASPPAGTQLALTVERVPDGEVSTYLTDILAPGDMVEIRGPIGGYFIWEASQNDPLLLIGGGSGIVPLMAMLRQRAGAGNHTPTRLLFSSRSQDDIIYRDELDRLARADPTLQVIHTLTRGQPPGWTGYRRRVDAAMLAEVAWPAAQHPLAYICGPTPFVEVAAAGLAGLNYEPARIKTERFGPTGGK